MGRFYHPHDNRPTTETHGLPPKRQPCRCESTEPLEFLVDQREHVGFFGECAGFELRVLQLAVERKFKATAARGDQFETFDLLLKSTKQCGRQTDGLRFVASHRAVFESDFHATTSPDQVVSTWSRSRQGVAKRTTELTFSLAGLFATRRLLFHRGRRFLLGRLLRGFLGHRFLGHRFFLRRFFLGGLLFLGSLFA